MRALPACVILLALAWWSGVVQAARPVQLVGHWLGAYRGQAIDLRFSPDGSGSWQHRPMKWDVRYGQLHIEHADSSEIFAMKADAETLVIAGGDMATLLVLVRAPDDDEEGPPDLPP